MVTKMAVVIPRLFHRSSGGHCRHFTPRKCVSKLVGREPQLCRRRSALLAVLWEAGRVRNGLHERADLDVGILALVVVLGVADPLPSGSVME